MDTEQTNKTKTYFVIILFMMIILLSAYVVIDKILTRNKEDLVKDTVYKENILENSNDIIELSLQNKVVNNLHNFVNNEKVDYLLYQNKKNKLSWDMKSLIVMNNLEEYKNGNSFDIVNIDKEIFEEKYKEIFGDSLNKEIRASSNCPTTAYNIEDGIYSINLSCYENDNKIYYKTFFKNITLEDDTLFINKYYVFIKEVEDLLNEDYILYKSDKLKEEDIIASNISYNDINNYISSMNVISYVYKKDSNGNYYLNSVK